MDMCFHAGFKLINSTLFRLMFSLRKLSSCERPTGVKYIHSLSVLLREYSTAYPARPESCFAHLHRQRFLCCAVPQYLLRSMRLAVAAGSNAWLVVNAASAVWNNYLPIMQRERYADLPGILLPVLQTLLQVSAALHANRRRLTCQIGTPQLLQCAVLWCARAVLTIHHIAAHPGQSHVRHCTQPVLRPTYGC
jgi:hypothetical protein